MQALSGGELVAAMNMSCFPIGNWDDSLLTELCTDSIQFLRETFLKRPELEHLHNPERFAWPLLWVVLSYSQ